MSRLSELIAKLCPDGVEYKTLGEVIVLCFGERITKSKSIGTAYPVYGGGGESFRTDNWNREDKCVVSRFAMSEQCVRHVSGKFWLMDSGLTFEAIDSRLDEMYIEKWLSANQLKIYACSTKSAQRNLKTDLFLRLRIPVPPIEVQREIVRVLDSFQELDDVLTAEIEAREKQFEKYRDELLEERLQKMCPDGVAHKALSDIEDEGLIKLGRGKVISKKAIAATPGDYPIYSSAATNEGLFGKYGKWMFDDTRITWSVDGGGKFFYRQGGRRYSVTNVCGWMQVTSEEIDAKYLYYTLSNEWSKKVFDYVHKAHPSVIREEYVLPFPPIEVQREIVRILDSFQEHIEALHCERDARCKQFEHYRDRLLVFPEKVA